MHISSTNFDKGIKNTKLEKGSVFNKWYLENWMSTCKRMKLDPYLTSLPKINSNQITDLNVKPKTVKLLEENVGCKILDIDLGNIIFGYDTKKHRQQKETL